MLAVYAGALVATSLVNVILIVYAYCHRGRQTGVMLYIGGILCSIFYAVGYAFEILSKSLAQVIFWLRIEYIGIAFFPAFWLLLAFTYACDKRILKRSYIIGLLIIPIITLLAHYTNFWHHLFYRQLEIHSTSGLMIAVTDKGPLYWLNITYMYAALLYGDFLLFKLYHSISKRYKFQIAGLVIGSFLPFLGNFIYLAGLSPESIDLSPLMIALSTPIYGWSLFRFQLLDLVPIVRDKVFEAMREGVMVLDEQNRVVDYNPALQAIFPDLSVQVLGERLDKLNLHAKFVPEFLEDSSEFEVAVVRGAEILHFNCRISLVSSRGKRIIGKIIVLNEITEKVLLVEKLKRLAMIDETTQIYNRRKFMEQSTADYKAAKVLKQSMGMIMFDIDHFKDVNDIYGHTAGDAALYSVAQLCKEQLGSGAVFGRYGGEEFCICLTNTAYQKAREIADTLRQAIAETDIEFENSNIKVTASFGLSFVSDAGQSSLEQLLKEADQAMYKAKDAGRNTVVSYCNVIW